MHENCENGMHEWGIDYDERRSGRWQSFWEIECMWCSESLSKDDAEARLTQADKMEVLLLKLRDELPSALFYGSEHFVDMINKVV